MAVAVRPSLSRRYPPHRSKVERLSLEKKVSNSWRLEGASYSLEAMLMALSTLSQLDSTHATAVAPMLGQDMGI